MTIREVAESRGVSVQSIYKKLRNRKIDLATLKDRTGQLTEEGIRQITALFDQKEPDQKPLKPEIEKLKTQVETLTTQVEMLKAQVELLTSERDNLREALKREQTLIGMTLQKIALPAPEASKGLKQGFKRFTSWFKHREKEETSTIKSQDSAKEEA